MTISDGVNYLDCFVVSMLSHLFVTSNVMAYSIVHVLRLTMMERSGSNKL
jgi:hypothetical protein